VPCAIGNVIILTLDVLKRNYVVKFVLNARHLVVPGRQVQLGHPEKVVGNRENLEKWDLLEIQDRRVIRVQLDPREILEKWVQLDPLEDQLEILEKKEIREIPDQWEIQDLLGQQVKLGF
jgi:hypothetical protein